MVAAMSASETDGNSVENAPTGSPSSREARRQRTLLHTAPIHALETNKAMWEGDWEAYDMRRLQMSAIETTLDHQGLEGGISRRSLSEAIAQVAAQMAPDRPRAQHLEAAERVLSHLLNEASGSEFLYPYQELIGTG